MKTTNNFDDIIRQSFRPLGGTSSWFTKKLMLRIEQEKNIATQKNLSKIGILMAFCSLVMSLSTIMLPWWATHTDSILANTMMQIRTYVLLTLKEFVAPIYYGITFGSHTNFLALALGALAILSWDMMLNKSNKHHAS